MKKPIFILVFILSLSTLTIKAQWNFVGPAGISEGWSLYNKIDIDAASGFPVVVYNDNNKAVCLKYNGVTWENVGESTFQNFSVGDIIDFKIDKKNNYILLFHNYLNFKSSCIRFDGNIWQYVGSEYISEKFSAHQTLGIDTSGIVYFVMEHDIHQIFKENGYTWQNISSEGLGAGGLAFPNLRFDNDNIPILAYTGPYFFANCSKFVENKWIPVGNTNISASNTIAENTNLHITQDNDYYIVFRDAYVRCFKWNKTSNIWELVGKAGSELEKLGIAEDLVSDSESNIYLVASYYGTDKAQVQCYSFNGENWSQLGGTAISESEAGYLELAFSEKKQKLYCSYNDFRTSKATVKEYNLTTGINTEYQNSSLKIYPNPSTGNFFVEIPGEKFSVEIYNINGAQICSYRNNYNKAEIKESFLRKGIYLVKIVTQNNYIRYKKLIII